MTWIKLLVIAAAFVAGWFSGGEYVRNDWEADIKIRTQAHLAALEKNQKTIIALEEQKNENLAKIDQLANSVRTIRVRVPSPPCTGSLRDSTPASGSETTVTASGDVSDQAQRAFDEFRQGLESDYAEADKLIEQCRVVMDWAKSF